MTDDDFIDGLNTDTEPSESDPELKSLYDKYNKEVWLNKLPTDVLIYYKQFSNRGGDCNNYKKQIRIASRYKNNEKEKIRVLLHEMTHLSLPSHMKHNNEFQRHLKWVAQMTGEKYYLMKHCNSEAVASMLKIDLDTGKRERKRELLDDDLF